MYYREYIMLIQMVIPVLICLVPGYESADDGNEEFLAIEDWDESENDLTKMLDGKLFADINLKCGDQVYAAHRNILSMKSAFFKSMFLQYAKQEDPVIIISDIDCDIFSSFLRYIYSEKLSDLPTSKLERLYMAANKYAIVSLKVDCAISMEINASLQNIWDYLVLADTYADSALKNLLISKLLMLLKSLDILKTKSFLDFGKRHPELAIEIYQKYAEKQSDFRNYPIHKLDWLDIATGVLLSAGFSLFKIAFL